MAQYNDRREMVDNLGLVLHRTLGPDAAVFVWPEEANGSKYDRFVVIEEFSDGSAAIYLNKGAGGRFSKREQMRRMVKVPIELARD